MKNSANDSMGLILLQSSLLELDVLIAGSGGIPDAGYEADSRVVSKPGAPELGLYVSFRNPKVYDAGIDHMNPGAAQNLSKPRAGNVLQEYFSLARSGLVNSLKQLKSLLSLG